MDQIFFSHSSKNTLLIGELKKSFDEIDIKPYFAFSEQEGRDPKTKIQAAITDSKAVFVLVTQEVLDEKRTRDWVSYEIGFANGLEKGTGEEKRVFAWVINVKEEDVFAFLKYVTDYKVINLKYKEKSISESDSTEYHYDAEDIKNFVKEIQEKASEVIKLEPIVPMPKPPKTKKEPLGLILPDMLGEVQVPTGDRALKLIPPTFEITQRLPDGKRELPDVGFNIQNPNNSPMKVTVLARVLLGEKELARLSGHYGGERIWNLNPLTGVRGHFPVPLDAVTSKESLEVKVKVTYMDRDDNVHDELLEVGYVYMRDRNDWFFNP